MKDWRAIIVLFAIFAILPACSPDDSVQQRLIASAQTIPDSPFSRDVLVETFGLDNTPSRNPGTSIRNGTAYYTEEWDLVDGYTITAMGSKSAQGAVITRTSINEAINDPRFREPAPIYVTFKEFVIRGASGVTVFDSDDQRP